MFFFMASIYILKCVPTQSQFKTYLCHSVVSLGTTLYGTFPCLVVLAGSSKLKSCFKWTAKVHLKYDLVSLKAGWDNCLPYV